MEFIEKHKLLIAIIILIILVIFVAGQNKTPSIINATDPESVSELVSDDEVVIIDVREEEEYNEGHIPQARNIPYTQIKNKVDYDLDTKIAVYCQTGARSHLAAAFSLIKWVINMYTIWVVSIIIRVNYLSNLPLCMGGGMRRTRYFEGVVRETLCEFNSRPMHHKSLI